MVEFFTVEHGRVLPGLFDGGFQGIGNFLPGSILPRRKPIGQELSDDDLAFNRRLSPDRIIVENFYGRKKKLWRMAKDVYRGSVAHALKVNTVSTWLTDLSVKWMPLCKDAVGAPDEALIETGAN